MQSKAKSNRKGTATHSKGQAKVEHILEAAKSILTNQGYSSLSMRKIAAEAGMTVGNLHYYYPNKGDLLKDLLETITNAYLDEFTALRQRAGHSPKDQFAAVLGHWVQDLSTRQTTVFFPELWALANHDEQAARLMDQLYGQIRAMLFELIGNINPKLNAKQKKELAVFISSSLEGLTMFAGYRKPYASMLPKMKSLAIEEFTRLIANTPA